MKTMKDERMQHVDDMEEVIISNLGDRGALDAITQALSYDQKEELYSYIVRVYGLGAEDETEGR